MGTEIYEDIGLSTGVMAADPHKLIEMVLQKIMQEIDQAIHCINENDIPRKLSAINNAIDAVSYLRECLNKDQGDKEVAALVEKLADVYTTVEDMLVKANLKNDINQLQTAKKLLATICEAWVGIKSEVSPA